MYETLASSPRLVPHNDRLTASGGVHEPPHAAHGVDDEVVEEKLAIGSDTDGVLHVSGPQVMAWGLGLLLRQWHVRAAFNQT